MATALLDAERAAAGGEGYVGAGGSGSDHLRTRETTHRLSGGHPVGQQGAGGRGRCEAMRGQVFEVSMRTVKA